MHHWNDCMVLFQDPANDPFDYTNEGMKLQAEDESYPEDGYFVIYPAKAKVAGLTPGSKSLKVKAKDQKASVLTGYQISYRANGTKKRKAVDSKKNKKTIRKLKKGKKYQVRVRGYVKVDGEKYYGKWSAVKTSKKIK